MPRVAILYDSLVWSQQELKRQFEERGIPVGLFDVDKLPEVDGYFKDYALVLNRVYPSAPDRGKPHVLPKTLYIVRVLEEQGIPVINNYNATKADFSKYESHKMMAEAGIPTPRTCLVENLSGARAFIEEVGLPVVIKNDSGGRSASVTKASTLEAAEREIKKRLEASKNGYGRFILQEFVPSGKPYDLRFSVVGDKVIFSGKRTLLPRDLNEEGESEYWLASLPDGSVAFPYPNPSQQEIEIAIEASRAIGAEINDIDIHIRPDGELVVIENNPTPNHNPKYKEIGTNKIVKIVEHIMKKYLSY